MAGYVGADYENDKVVHEIPQQLDPSQAIRYGEWLIRYGYAVSDEIGRKRMKGTDLDMDTVSQRMIIADEKTGQVPHPSTVVNT